MALTAAQTAQKELDKAVADVERKRKLLATCTERAEQAQTAVKSAGAEVAEAIAFADWLSEHPALKGAEQTPAELPEAERPEADGVPGQTTVEEQIAEVSAGHATPEEVAATPGASIVDDLFATA